IEWKDADNEIKKFIKMWYTNSKLQSEIKQISKNIPDSEKYYFSKLLSNYHNNSKKYIDSKIMNEMKTLTNKMELTLKKNIMININSDIIDNTSSSTEQNIVLNR